MNGEDLPRPYSQYDIDYALMELLDAVGIRTPFTERNASFIIKANVSVDEVRDLVRESLGFDPYQRTYADAEEDRILRSYEHDD